MREWENLPGNRESSPKIKVCGEVNILWSTNYIVSGSPHEGPRKISLETEKAHLKLRCVVR